MRSAFLFLALLCGSQFGVAGQELSSSFEAGVAVGGGVSSYDFEDFRGSTNVFSQLDFPLPPFGLRVQGDLRWHEPNALPSLQLHGEASLFIVDPVGVFYDQDWYSLDAYPTVPRVLFSYTESATQALVVSMGGVGSWVLTGSSAWSVEGRLAASLRRSRWEAIDLNGWSYDFQNSNTLYWSRIVNKTVLTYELWQLHPAVGVGFRVRPEDGWELSGWLDAVLAIDWDIDDHVLRTKRSTSLAVGIGGTLGLQTQWFPTQGNQGLVFTLGTTASASRSPGTQVQYWYGTLDGDPANPIPAGTTYAGLSHLIRSVEVSFSATVGYLW